MALAGTTLHGSPGVRHRSLAAPSLLLFEALFKDFKAHAGGVGSL